MRVLLTGGGGMLGRTIHELWPSLRPYDELIVLTRRSGDLLDPVATKRVISQAEPDAVIHAAAKVGGIAAKLRQPVEFLLDNLVLDTNVIRTCIELGVPEFLYIGSAVVYPEKYDKPFEERDLLSDSLEPANEGYALAKIAGTKLCEYACSQYELAYKTVLPSNLYGPHDHFLSPEAHLVPSALMKVHKAKLAGDPFVTIWGDGTARREFTFSEDVASWIIKQIGSLSSWPARLNLGKGVDHSVTDYYLAAKKAVGYEGQFLFDTEKPSGAHQRLLNSTAASTLGWVAPTTLEDGMARCYDTLMQLDVATANS